MNIFFLRNMTNKVFASTELHWIKRQTILRAIKVGVKAMDKSQCNRLKCILKDVTVVI